MGGACYTWEGGGGFFKEPESLGRAEKPEHRALEKGQVGSGQPSIHNTALTPQTRRLHSNQT